MTISQR